MTAHTALSLGYLRRPGDGGMPKPVGTSISIRALPN